MNERTIVMEGYGREVKREKLVDSQVTNLYLPSSSTYKAPCALKVTEIMSYRTNLRGTWVPDFQADPYSGFLSNAVDVQRQRMRLKKEKGEPIEKKDAAKYPPHTDNGHAYYKLVREVSTSVRSQKIVFTTRGSTDPATRTILGGPFFAYNARPNALNRIRMPFLFNKNGNSTSEQYSAWSTPAIPPADKLDAYGKKAIAITAPTAPEINGLSAILEFVQDVPALPLKTLFTEKGLHKKVSGEFLNYQFGLLPTVSDLVKVAKTLSNITFLLKQFEKDAGNGVRRDFVFPYEEKTEVFYPGDLEDQGVVSVQNPIAPWRSGGSSSYMNVSYQSIQSTLTMQLTKKIRFSGSFSYVLPLSKATWSNFDKYMAQADRAFGLKPSLVNTWNILPWSWLVDWFLEVQSSLALYDRINQDNLVLNYGYVTAKTSCRAVQHSDVQWKANEKSPFPSINTVFETFRFERIRANPYGFIGPTGTSGGLSSIQMAILGALGLSRR